MKYFYHLVSLLVLLFMQIGCKLNPEDTTGPEKHYDVYGYETSEDPDAPYVREEWQAWIRTNHDLIVSLDSENYSDLEFIDTYVENKSVVLLGEVAHGIAEQNRIRVRLIKYLHERFDFNVVAFESGFYDCYTTNKDIAHKKPDYSLNCSLYGMWNTTDLLYLFNYISQTHQTNSPLHLAGFDIHSSGRNCETRPQFFRDILVNIDSTLSERIYEQDKILIQWRVDKDFVDNYISMNYSNLYQLYGEMINCLTEYEEVLTRYFDTETISIAKQTAVSVKKDIEQRYDISNPPRLRPALRDQQMAENFKFIKESLYPGFKIIIWAHNCHIQRDLASVTLVDYPRNMGSWLSQAYGEQLYVIGSLAYRGRINYGEVADIKITQPEAIEAILYYARKKHYFIDFSLQTQTDGNSWMFQQVYQTYIHATGAYGIKYIPREQYDAIVFIDSVSQPVYIF